MPVPVNRSESDHELELAWLIAIPIIAILFCLALVLCLYFDKSYRAFGYGSPAFEAAYLRGYEAQREYRHRTPASLALSTPPTIEETGTRNNQVQL